MLEKRNPSRPARPRDITATRTRVVVAAVRPEQPNPFVIRAAADLADRHEAELLLLGTLRPLLTDYTQVLPYEAVSLDAAAAELFANAVELLYDRPLRWSVGVFVGHPAHRVNELAQHCDLRALVAGRSRRRRQWWRKVDDQATVVVTA